ncbi:hypothetical protein ACRYCC_13300 [Actinomadura scrupuli]|uniref:hypothetical protein n=1 Tax=Actinomadura scrupuli TaxID=559629 RepID=UPI003D989ABF
MDEGPDTERRSRPDVMRLDFALTSAGTPVAIEALLREGPREWGLLERFEEAVKVFTDLLRFALASGGVDVKLSVDRREPSLHFEVLDVGLELPAALRDRIEAITGGLWSRHDLDGGHLVKATVSRTGGPDAPPL